MQPQQAVKPAAAAPSDHAQHNAKLIAAAADRADRVDVAGVRADFRAQAADQHRQFELVAPTRYAKCFRA